MYPKQRSSCPVYDKMNDCKICGCVQTCGNTEITLADKALFVQVSTLIGQHSHSCHIASTIDVVGRAEDGNDIGDCLLTVHEESAGNIPRNTVQHRKMKFQIPIPPNSSNVGCGLNFGS